MSTFLKNTTDQGEAAFGDYGTADLLVEIPATWVPQAQATFRHQGTDGFWYVIFARDVVGSGPTTSLYSIKLGPGERYTEHNPPMGDVWLLADGDVDGALSWYIGGYTP